MYFAYILEKERSDRYCIKVREKLDDGKEIVGYASQYAWDKYLSKTPDVYSLVE